MNKNIFKLLLSAAFVMCCTFPAWAQLGTPPDDEIWYTTTSGEMLYADFNEVFGSEVISHYYTMGFGVIKLKEPVTKVGDHAFNGYSRIGYLKKISLPNSVKSIGYRAFYWQEDLTEISLGNSVETIGNDAFRDCDGLETITIPASVTSIGEYAFYDCNVLKSVSLGNSVKIIGSNAFRDCDALETIAIPASVTSIGENAFYDCNVLKAVYLGNSVTTIGNSAFYDCDALEAIAIPASVTSIGENAFYDCDKLKFATIGRGVTNISQYAFYNCNELKSVAIDGNGMTLGYEAFYHCDKLETVSFLGDTPPSSFGDYCFSKCSSNLKYHVLEEYYDTYNGNSNLSGNVVAGPPYNEIWYTTNNGGTAAGHVGPYGTPPTFNAYMGNHGVQFFDGNLSEFDINYNCFSGCVNLVSAILPSSINSIGQSAFDACSNLVSVSIPNSVTSIGNYAFEYCTSLQTITIPENVNNISYYAFGTCTALRSVTILGTIRLYWEQLIV